MRTFTTCMASVLLLGAVYASVLNAEGGIEEEVDQVLYRVPVGEERELVVLRGPDRNPDQLLDEHLLGRLGEQAGNMYEVSTEIRRAGSPPLVLTSRVRFEDEIGLTDRGTLVLDHHVHQGSVVFALAEGSDVKLWQIDIGRGARVEFSPRTEDGRLTAEVRDNGVGSGVSYEETEPGSLFFRAIDPP